MDFGFNISCIPGHFNHDSVIFRKIFFLRKTKSPAHSNLKGREVECFTAGELLNRGDSGI